MFKNLIVYHIDPQWRCSLDELEQALQAAVFTPCGATQAESAGWVPPRGEAHGALVESVGGQWILRYQQEVRLLPASVVQQRVQEKCAAIERESGRQPGKKERRDLKEEARLDLLPQAFTRQSGMWVWIDPQAHWLVLDASAQGKADAVVSLLVEHVPGLALSLVDTAIGPQAAMAQWLLTQEAPAGFSIDQECELKAGDESRAVVRYARHPLDIDEVRQHVQAGKLPTKLAMTWEGRVSFLLTESLQLKKVALLDTVLEEGEGGADADAGFDADVALVTGELGQLLPDLLQALGGEARTPIAAVAAALIQVEQFPVSGSGRSSKASRGTVTGPHQAPADSAPDEAPF